MTERPTKRQRRPPIGIHSLTDELMFEVFYHLPFSYWEVRAHMVCKRWHTLLWSDAHIRSRLDVADEGTSASKEGRWHRLMVTLSALSSRHDWRDCYPHLPVKVPCPFCTKGTITFGTRARNAKCDQCELKVTVHKVCTPTFSKLALARGCTCHQRVFDQRASVCCMCYSTAFCPYCKEWKELRKHLGSLCKVCAPLPEAQRLLEI